MILFWVYGYKLSECAEGSQAIKSSFIADTPVILPFASFVSYNGMDCGLI